MPTAVHVPGQSPAEYITEIIQASPEHLGVPSGWREGRIEGGQQGPHPSILNL